MANDKTREKRLRRMAFSNGLVLRKSRTRYIHPNDHGEFMIVHPTTNTVVYGEKCNLSLDDVEAYFQSLREFKYEHKCGQRVPRG